MNSVAKYRAHVHYGYQKTTLHAVDSILIRFHDACIWTALHLFP